MNKENVKTLPKAKQFPSVRIEVFPVSKGSCGYIARRDGRDIQAKTRTEAIAKVLAN